MGGRKEAENSRVRRKGEERKGIKVDITTWLEKGRRGRKELRPLRTVQSLLDYCSGRGGKWKWEWS
jgi:hypothetical protein